MSWFRELQKFNEMQVPSYYAWKEIWTCPSPDGFHKYRFFKMMPKIHKKCKWCSVYNNNNWTRSSFWIILFFLLMIGILVPLIVYAIRNNGFY